MLGRLSFSGSFSPAVESLQVRQPENVFSIGLKGMFTQDALLPGALLGHMTLAASAHHRIAAGGTYLVAMTASHVTQNVPLPATASGHLSFGCFSPAIASLEVR